MPNEDGTLWLVFNGEIYNHAELRSRARAPRPRLPLDHSDTEMIVHLYEEEGPAASSGSRACSRSRSGTTRRRELLLARDRLGIKPLY